MKGVDWQNETFRPTWSQDHNVSVSGGNDKTKYAFSFADFLENGIFKNSAFNKITAKVRVSHKISESRDDRNHGQLRQHRQARCGHLRATTGVSTCWRRFCVHVPRPASR